MLDDELRALEQAARVGGASEAIHYARALQRVGRGGEARAFLLGAICARPEDEALRLAYASFLESEGDARGEFVRLQVELAGMPEHSVERVERELRAQALLARHRLSWLPRELERHLAHPATTVFRRGFVERLHGGLTPEFLEQVGEALFAREPVRAIGISFNHVSGENAAERWAPTGALRHVRELDVSGAQLGPERLRTVLASPHLERLEGLRVHGIYVKDVAKALVSAPSALAKLRSLELETPFTDADARVLGESPHVARLERLVVRPVSPEKLTDEGVAALAWSKNLRGLRELSLCGSFTQTTAEVITSSELVLEALTLDGRSLFNRIDDSGAAILAGAASLRSLKRLALPGAKLGSEGARALASSPHLAQAELELDAATIGVEGCRALLAREVPVARLDLALRANGLPGSDLVLGAPGAERLRALILDVKLMDRIPLVTAFEGARLRSLARLTVANVLGDPALEALGRAAFPSLRELLLDNSGVTGRGVRALVAAAWFAGVRRLFLIGSPLRDEGAAELARAKGAVWQLGLAKSAIGAEGLAALAGSSWTRELATLDLSGNPVGRDGVAALTRAEAFPALAELDLTEAGIDAAAAELLLSWPGLARVQRLVLSRNGLRERDEEWRDEDGHVERVEPADPVVARLRERLGARLSIDR